MIRDEFVFESAEDAAAALEYIGDLKSSRWTRKIVLLEQEPDWFVWVSNTDSLIFVSLIADAERIHIRGIRLENGEAPGQDTKCKILKDLCQWLWQEFRYGPAHPKACHLSSCRNVTNQFEGLDSCIKEVFASGELVSTSVMTEDNRTVYPEPAPKMDKQDTK